MDEVLEGAAWSPTGPPPGRRWGWPFTLWWLRSPVLLIGWYVAVAKAQGPPLEDCRAGAVCPDLGVSYALVFGIVFAVPVLLVMAPVLGCLVGTGWGVASLFFVYDRPSITVFGVGCFLVLIALLADRYRFRPPVDPYRGPLQGYRPKPPGRLLRGPVIGLAIALLAAGFLVNHYRTAAQETSAHLDRAVLVEGRVTSVGTDPVDPKLEVRLPGDSETRQFDSSSVDEEYRVGDPVPVLVDPLDPGWDRLGNDAPSDSLALLLVTVCLAVAVVMIGRRLAIGRLIQSLASGSARTQPVVVGFRHRTAYLHDFPPAGSAPVGAFAVFPHRGPRMITGRNLPVDWTRVPETEKAPALTRPLPGVPPASDGLPPYGYPTTASEQWTSSSGFSDQRPDPWPPGPAPTAPWQEQWGAALPPLVPAVFVGSLRPGGWGVLIAGDTIWWPRRPVRRLRRIPIWSRTQNPTVSRYVSPWPPPPESGGRAPFIRVVPRPNRF